MLTVSQFIAAVRERTGKTRSRITIGQLCAAGTIHAEKPGRDWLIPESEVDRYITTHLRADRTM